MASNSACAKNLGMRVLQWLATFFLAVHAIAQAATEVHWTDRPPIIDGDASDPEWKDASTISNFSQGWQPNSGVNSPTKARLLWDREYLYFTAECADSNIVASITEHDGKLWETDVFEMFFQTSQRSPGYFEFEVNAANAVFDAYFPDRAAYKQEGAAKRNPFHLETAVKIHGTLNHPGDLDHGWTVEGRIPWRDFLMAGGRPEPGAEWRFSLARIDYDKEGDTGRLSATAPLKKPNFHRVEDYQPLVFSPPAWLKPGPSGGTWTNRSLLSTAEPPPAFRAVKMHSNPAAKFYLTAAPLPGTRDIIYLENTDYWGGDTRVWRYSPDHPGVPARMILTVPEKGYSIATHPGFVTNGLVFFGANGPQDTSPKHSRIVRYRIDPKTGMGDPESRLMIIEWLSDGHNGAGICFGRDGMLYVTSGDGSSDSDANVAGQNLSKLTSKVLRLDVTNAERNHPYDVPADNPFVGRSGIRPETWVYGCRNPWRITSDPVSGQIWVGENGQDQWEYAYLLRRGDNHGWSVMEGSHPFLSQRKLGPDKPVKPEIEHPHSEFRSLTGGVVYRGKKHPALTGAYIYGDFSTGRIWAMLHDGTNVVWHRQIAVTGLSITGFGTDPDGEVLIADHVTGLYRLELAPPRSDLPPFPRKLSETALFASLKTMAPANGVFPYEINAPQWADGALTRHWLALPAGQSLAPLNVKSWNFSNETVLVQQLEWPKPGGATVRLETRLLVKLQNEWTGYSYVWRTGQEDADLASSDGDELDLGKFVPGDTGPQWHVPSRAECMMCHSRAANYAIGTTSLQLNHQRSDGSNQLEVWEAARILQNDFVGFESWWLGLSGQGDDMSTASDSHPTVLLPRKAASVPAQVNPYDTSAPLERRVRSYLAANCAQCHVMSGGGNSAIDFDFSNSLAGLKIVGQKPQHWPFDIERPLLIAPGEPARSVLYRRISQREEAAMPPLAINRVDQKAAELFRTWILQLK